MTSHTLSISFHQQKERERQKHAAKKVIEGKKPPQRTENDSRKAKGGDNRGEFDDLISALRTGDVFGDEISKIKGRRRQNIQPKTALKAGVSERERPSPKLEHRF